MQLSTEAVIRRLRRQGIEITAIRNGGKSANRWNAGGAVLHGVNELRDYAIGLGAIPHDTKIARVAIVEDEEPVEEPPAPTLREDAAQCAERFAQVLSGLCAASPLVHWLRSSSGWRRQGTRSVRL